MERDTQRVDPEIASKAEQARRILMTPPRPRPSAEEERTLTQARRTSLDWLTAYEWGEGSTVFAVHGWGGHSGQFAGFVDALVPLGYRVAAVDAPGHGASTREVEVNILDFAAGVERAMTALGGADVLVAHSLGCFVAARAIVRGLIAPARVVFLAPTSSIVGTLERFARLLNLEEAEARLFIQLVEEHVGATAADLDAANTVSGVAIPLLILHDPDDAEVPFSDAQAIAASWSESRLISVRGVGHRGIVASPDAIAMAVEFVQGISSS